LIPNLEQRANRARALVAARIVSALMALLVGADLARGLHDGYLKLGIGVARGPSRDFILLDTPTGFALGMLFLEVCAVFFVTVAVQPRHALRPRVLLPSIAVVAVVSVIIRVMFG